MISSQTIAYLGIWLIGLVFGAGGAWTKLRQTRRDVNGLGSKLRRTHGLLIRWAAADPDKEAARAKIEEIARIVEGK